MKKITHYLIATAVVICTPLLSLAHAGHGHDNPLSPGHYVTNPQHSIPLMLIVAASVAFAWLLNRIVDRVNQK